MVNFKNLNDINIHFIGIGGISMSALALFCEKFGACVSGSDMTENNEVIKLKKNNISVFIGHDKQY